MTIVRPKQPQVEQDSSVSDANRVIRIIVKKFGGDTVAFFNSIKPDTIPDERKTEREEARLARRFAKSA